MGCTELPQQMGTTVQALSYLPTPQDPSPGPTGLSCSPGSIDHPRIIRLVSKATIFDEPIIIHIKLQLRLHHSLRQRQEMVTQPPYAGSPSHSAQESPSSWDVAWLPSGEGGCAMV